MFVEGSIAMTITILAILFNQPNSQSYLAEFITKTSMTHPFGSTGTP